MDGRRSFPEDQEPRWYAGERGHGYEPEWRGADEARQDAARYPEDERVPEQRGAADETRYDAAAYREPGRRTAREADAFGARDDDSGRFAAFGPGGNDRSDATGYRVTRSRRAEPDPLDVSGELGGEWAGRRAARDTAADPFAGRDTGTDLLAARDTVASPLAAREASEGSAPPAAPVTAESFGGRQTLAGPDPLTARDANAGASAAFAAATNPAAVPAAFAPAADPAAAPGDGEPTRPAPLSGYPIVEPGRPADPPHPLEMPTGPMPPVGPRADLPYPPAGVGDAARPPVGDGVYRTRRPALAVLFAVLVLVFEIPALRLLASGVTGDPVSAGNIVSGTFLVVGLPIFAIGLYGLRTGGLSLSEGGRGWLRPPTAYLTVALALFVAAALAAG